ncbi:BURP domain protein RD22-like [Andrographis paniculata]|uniref:BURP domain protein RD22-like n=1 Tax=Andrographis paniculata TaxID=175694 RepID=UPI0021E8D77D|nr:BURP domain protein RD22-like [Andrographis paniculata]
MEFKYFPCILALLPVVLIVVGSQVEAEADSLASEAYWKSVLPNTPIPKSLNHLLHPSTEWQENKGTAVNVGHGGVGVYTGKPGHRTNVGVRKGGVTVGTRTKRGKPVYVGVHPGYSPFNYYYAATETQLRDDPNVALFFVEKDLHPGKTMNLHFSDSDQYTTEAKFLPRKVSESIPFSSNKLPEILHKFSVDPSSDEAVVIKKTIKECEDTAVNGEEKLCATSLESMVDFSTSRLGKDVEVMSTAADTAEMKKYSVVGVKSMSSGKPAVVCHKQKYPYAVFYCHETSKTAVYKVSLAAADMSRAEAVAVCHRDTAAWNPKHLAFRVLKVKPGSVPICHFLPADHVVWTHKN